MKATLSRKPGKQDEYIYDFQWQSATQIKQPASQILIGDDLYSASDLVFDFSNGTGDNGLDTGSATNNAWYALYAVPRSDNKAYILKASLNMPIEAGGSGPSGYSNYRYLGMFRCGDNDAVSADILRFLKIGKKIRFINVTATCSLFGMQIDTQAANPDYNTGLPQGMTGVAVPFNKALYDFYASTNTTSGRSYVELHDASHNSYFIFQSASGSGFGGLNHAVDVPIDQTNFTEFRTVSGAARTGLNLMGFTDPYIK